LPEEETYRHALICGPTGSSKTTGVFEPNLFLRTETSAIVTEATATKGRAGLFERTSGYRRAKGQEVFYFNPDDLRSHRINPISFVDSYRDARRITEIIMQSTTLSTHRGDQSWEMAEKTLLTALVLHVVSLRSEKRDTFAEIMAMIAFGGDGLVQIAQESPVEQARELITTFLLTTTEPFRNLVINQLVNRLDLWQQPRIRALTETTDIDFKDLKDKLFTIYLAVPAAKHELKPLSALILNTILELVGTIGFTKPLALFLDEFTNFGFIRGMPQRLTIMRHDKIPVVLGVQDYAQLENMYKEEAKLLISQPGTRIFFKPNDYNTAELISKMLGTAIEQTNQIASTGHLKETKEKEPLLSIDDLLNLRSEERWSGIERAQLIAFLPRVRPVRESAFSWKDFEHLSNTFFYPPPYAEAIALDEGIAISAPSQEESILKTHMEPNQAAEDLSITGWQ
jgi:type IV secretion system protein VirD4